MFLTETQRSQREAQNSVGFANEKHSAALRSRAKRARGKKSLSQSYGGHREKGRVMGSDHNKKWIFRTKNIELPTLNDE